MGLQLLAVVDALAEHLGIFVEEEQGQAGHQLHLPGGDDLNLVFLLFSNVVVNFDWLPNILAIIKYWRKGMSSVGSSRSPLKPLLRSPVLVPCVETSEGSGVGKVGVSEDLVLLLQNFERLLSVRVLFLVGRIFVQKGLFFDDVLVFPDHVCVPRGKALHLFQVLVMCGFVDPGVNNLGLRARLSGLFEVFLLLLLLHLLLLLGVFSVVGLAVGFFIALSLGLLHGRALSSVSHLPIK